MEQETTIKEIVFEDTGKIEIGKMTINILFLTRSSTTKHGNSVITKR